MAARSPSDGPGSSRERIVSEPGSGDVVADDALPVVARMVVEIRSDGTRTVARGAVEDLDGQRVAMEVRASSPWMMARQLVGALWTMPRRRRPSLRALLSGRRRDPDDER